MMKFLVPSLSFIAPVNAILYNNADPHFIDSEMDHFGVDPIKLENYLKENTFIRNKKCINKNTKKLSEHLF